MKNSSSGNSSWFTAVKRVFRSPSDGDDHLRKRQEKKSGGNWRWLYSRRKNYYLETKTVDDERRAAAIAVAISSTAAAEAAVKTAQAAMEVVKLSRNSDFDARRHRREAAAVVVQSFFRGYLARRALAALKGFVVLQAVIRGFMVRNRAKTTLKCIKSLVKLQGLVCNRRGEEGSSSNSTAVSLDPCGCSNLQVQERRKEDLNRYWRRRSSMDSCPMPSPRCRLNHFAAESPRTPSSGGMKPTNRILSSCSPRCRNPTPPSETNSMYSPRRSLSEDPRCCSFRPNYMAVTASAAARAKLSAAKMGLSEESSAKKRLLFTV